MEELIQIIFFILIFFGGAIFNIIKKMKNAGGADGDLMERLEEARRRQAEELERQEQGGASSAPPVAPPVSSPPQTVRGGSVSVPKPQTLPPKPVHMQPPSPRPAARVPERTSAQPQPETFMQDKRYAEEEEKAKRHLVERMQQKAARVQESNHPELAKSPGFFEKTSPLNKGIGEVGVGVGGDTESRSSLKSLTETEKMIVYSEILRPRFKSARR